MRKNERVLVYVESSPMLYIVNYSLCTLFCIFMLFGVCLFEYNITHIITEWALTGRRLVLYKIKQHSKSSLFQQFVW